MKLKKKSIIKRFLYIITHPKVYYKLSIYFITLVSERIMGVDFTKVEQAPSLGYDTPILNGYWSSSNHFLDRVLKMMNISSNDSILDIGCGKGHVLVHFSKYNFKRIVGIELHQKLYQIALNNLKRVNKTQIELYRIDARNFEGYADYNYFYLYNPFHSEIMKEVIAKIEKTLIVNRRKITIIYKNPTCHCEIVKSGIFCKKAEFNTEIKEIKYYIYAN